MRDPLFFKVASKMVDERPAGGVLQFRPASVCGFFVPNDGLSGLGRVLAARLVFVAQVDRATVS